MRIQEFVDQIFLINLPRRGDRLKHAMETLGKLGIEHSKVEVFDGYDRPRPDINNPESQPNGTFGCTSSHRGVLEIIAHRRIKRALVLEDDFEFAYTNATRRFRCDPQALFDEACREIPANFDLLYLAGHYAEVPQERISKHIIRVGRMFTTSSYVITSEAARKMAPYISGIGPIDCLFSEFTKKRMDGVKLLDAYCLEPRIFIQYTNHSDLHEKVENYEGCMMDGNHVKAMDEGRLTI